MLPSAGVYSAPGIARTMGDTIVGAIRTVALLVLVALPLTAGAANLLFLPRGGPWWTLAHAKAVLRRHGLALVALVAMLIPENLESAIDPWVTERLPWRDAPTAFIRGYEDGLHQAIQALPGRELLQPFLSIVYLVGFPVIIIATTSLSVWRDDGMRARRAAGAYALCFAFALPFYLLLPVNEVWFAHDPANHGAVQQLALHYPIVRDNLYAFNEVNNCLPSLHTAISVAMALVARGVPRYGRFAAVLASLIVASTLYLGIHWATDVVAGLLLAVVVDRLVRRAWPDLPAQATPATVAVEA